MVNTEIDRFPVADLPDRYNLKRTALYERFKALDIKPYKQSNKSYLDGDQLKQLDELHAHLQRGGGISDFLPSPQPLLTEPTQQLASLNQPGAFVTLIEVLTSRLVPAIVSKLIPPQPPLAHLEALERAYEKDWLLSTSELAQLLKLSPQTIIRYGNSFNEAGFTFTKAGTRARQETAWKVDKTPKAKQ
jgi:hypothetical protein